MKNSSQRSAVGGQQEDIVPDKASPTATRPTDNRQLMVSDSHSSDDRKSRVRSRFLVKSFLLLLKVWLCCSLAFRAEAEDVYSLFGKLFLSGRVEYDFTNRRNFLADTEEERVRQDNFNFDRLFRRGFHSVMVIEETAGTVKNILSLGEVPTTFHKIHL